MIQTGTYNSFVSEVFHFHRQVPLSTDLCGSWEAHQTYLEKWKRNMKDCRKGEILFFSCTGKRIFLEGREVRGSMPLSSILPFSFRSFFCMHIVSVSSPYHASSTLLEPSQILLSESIAHTPISLNSPCPKIEPLFKQTQRHVKK